MLNKNQKITLGMVIISIGIICFILASPIISLISIISIPSGISLIIHSLF